MAKFFKKSTLTPEQEERQEKRAAKVAGFILRSQRTWANFMAKRFNSLRPLVQKIIFSIFILCGAAFFVLTTISAFREPATPISTGKIERHSITPLQRFQHEPAVDSLSTISPDQ